jgi:hemerythrin superfamily protein
MALPLGIRSRDFTPHGGAATPARMRIHPRKTRSRVLFVLWLSLDLSLDTGERMDAVQLLIDQHRRLEKRLEEAVEATDPKERAELLARAGDDLAVHVASEEDVFYPAVKAKCTEDILLESLEEHLSLKRLLADLIALDPGDRTFEAKLKVLAEQTEHHHKEEEEHLFPDVRKLLDADQLDALGNEMVALQQRMCRDGDPREVVAAETDKAAQL